VEFYITKQRLGTPFNLICRQDGSVEKSVDVPEGILNINSKEAWLLSKIYNFSLPYFPPGKYVNSFREIVDKKQDIPWAHVMPAAIYKTAVKKYVSKLKELFLDLDLTYYKEHYLSHSALFGSLQPAKINPKIFLDNLKGNFGEHDSIKTFVPKNGYSEKPFYDRLTSTTCRLKTLKGPRILNLKKSYRQIIESRFGEEGKIYYLDFSSLEPRTLLAHNGKKDLPQDIYQHLINESGITASRDAIKTSIITRLYGGSNHTIIKQIKNLVDYPEDLIKLVDEYFGIEELKEKLLEEYLENDAKHIKNIYGRPIQCEDTAPYKLLNYFVQSSAVDVALCGFGQICDRVKKAGLQHKIVPLFILHDAIFFDIHNDYEYLVPKLCAAGSTKIANYEDTNFWLKMEVKWFIQDDKPVMMYK